MTRTHHLITACTALLLALPLAAQTAPRNTHSDLHPAVSASATALPVAAATAVPAAYGTTSDAVPMPSSLSTSGPRLQAGSIPLQMQADRTALELLPANGGRNSRNTALMIVGGAALIVGSVIDGEAGSLIMISGGLIGLYGLWQYLQ